MGREALFNLGMIGVKPRSLCRLQQRLVDEAAIETAVAKVMDLTPRGIRTHLGLNRPIFQRTAAYGHFGRQPDTEGGFSWEKTDLADKLKNSV